MIYNILKNIAFISLACSGISLVILIARKVLGTKGAWWRNIAWMTVVIRLCMPMIIKIPIDKLADKSSYVNSVARIRNILPLKESDIFINPSSQNAIANIHSTFAFSWSDLFIVIYLIGLMFFLARLFISIIKIYNMHSNNEPSSQIGVTQIYNDVKSRLGIKRPVPLLVSVENTTPALCGYLKPYVIIPKQFVDYATSHQLEQVFIHELTHYKNKDTLKLFLIEIAISIHWFNPFVYYLRQIIVRDIELACDEKVLKRIDRRHFADYGKVLIDCSNRNAITNSLAITTGFASKNIDIKERLQMIKKYNTKRNIMIGIFLITIIVVSLIVGTSTGFDKNKTVEHNLEGANRVVFYNIRRVIVDKCEEKRIKYNDDFYDKVAIELVLLSDSQKNLGQEIRKILSDRFKFTEKDIINKPYQRLDQAIIYSLLELDKPIQ